MGSFNFPQLGEGTRARMIEELAADIQSGTLAGSRDFSRAGHEGYPAAARHAFERGDEDTLAAALPESYFNETRTDKNGRVTRLNRTDSARKFADGEFLRFYLRGLCLRAQAEGVAELEVYRAKHSVNPRTESEAMIGRRVDPGALLADLRQNKGIDTYLGLPPGPHSGLAARYPQ